MTSFVFMGESPPIESFDDLLAYFRTGEKPAGEWRLGTEHEKIGFYLETRSPVPYEGANGIHSVLAALIEQFGWRPVTEGDNLIALDRGEANITLEPGGQVELSGAQLATAHDVCHELRVHLREIQAVSEPLGIVWLTLGRNPFVTHQEMPWVPKERYKVMRAYLPQKGSMALDMMVGTGTVQTNIDYSDEADMAKKLRVGMAAAPIINALFANSPFAAGMPSGYLSSRAHIWLNTDPQRCGIIPAAFEEGFGYRDYAEYALDVPMFFIHRDGRYIDYAGQSFRRFMEKGLDGHVATREDWALHLTTIFPEMRLKNYLELRMCDTGSRDMICALAALTRGLFYDRTTLDDAAHMLRDVSAEQFPAALENAARWGLQADLLGKPIWEWARELMALVRSGLKRLDARNAEGENEEVFLAPLDEIAETGKPHAALLMDLWNGPWKRSLIPLFSESYFH